MQEIFMKNSQCLTPGTASNSSTRRPYDARPPYWNASSTTRSCGTTASSENLSLPLYYSGLTDTAHVSVGGAAPTAMVLARDYSLVVPVSVPAKSTTWVLLTA